MSCLNYFNSWHNDILVNDRPTFSFSSRCVTNSNGRKVPKSQQLFVGNIVYYSINHVQSFSSYSFRVYFEKKLTCLFKHKSSTVQTARGRDCTSEEPIRSISRRFLDIITVETSRWIIPQSGGNSSEKNYQVFETPIFNVI